MCGPGAAILAGANIVGGGLGGYMQADAERKSINYNREVLAQNQILADMKAEDALKRGEERALTKGLKLRALYGTQKAEYGASGVDATRGTPARVMFNTRLMGGMDMMTIRHNTWREYKAYKQQARSFATQRDMLGGMYPDPWLSTFAGALGGAARAGGMGLFSSSPSSSQSSDVILEVN